MKKTWDYLIIPDSQGKIRKERIKKAREELRKRSINEILIVRGRDSEEDILYLGKILRKGDRIAIDTFPLHFKEYRAIIKRAVKQKKFPMRVKVENLKIEQDFKKTVYGILGLAEEEMKTTVNYQKNRSIFWQKIKDFFKKIIYLN